jgi:biopolymer transport protein ExbD
MRPPALILTALICAALAGCEDAPKKNSFGPSKDAPVDAPPASAVPKKEVAPDLEIDTVSTKVGFERALLQNPEGRAKLTQLLGDAKKWIEGQEVRVLVDRKAKVAWVATYLEELGKVGPSKITIRTETRKDYSQDQRFTPEAKAKAPACSLVAMVTSDFGTAVWRLSGGVASKRGRGMAGPDLSMTGETIERMGKSCPESSTFFVSVAEGVEWGLAFDLAASSRVLEKVKFEDTVLLSEIPTPGHKVDLKH